MEFVIGKVTSGEQEVFVLHQGKGTYGFVARDSKSLLLAVDMAIQQALEIKSRSGGVSMTEKFYRNQVLVGAMRQYIIDKVKNPLIKKIVSLANKYPEPTRENCIQPNSHILFDIEDKFFEYEENPATATKGSGREELFRAAFKLLIATYEHDPYYRFRFDWMLEEINKRDWVPRSRIPMHCWTEPGAIGEANPWSAVVAVEEPDVPMVIKKLATK